MAVGFPGHASRSAFVRGHRAYTTCCVQPWCPASEAHSRRSGALRSRGSDAKLGSATAIPRLALALTSENCVPMEGEQVDDRKLLLQLRYAFAYLNKKARAEEHQADLARREPELRKRRKEREAAAAKAKADEEKFQASLLTRPCTECGKPTTADPEFFLNPVQCERCISLGQSIHLGINARESIGFREVTIVQGGAPGLGKRK